MEIGFINDVPFCASVYQIGLPMSLKTNCVACSPDEVALLGIDSMM